MRASPDSYLFKYDTPDIIHHKDISRW